MEIDAPLLFAALGHPQRLAIFRLLMRRYPGHVPAGELAQALAVKPSTLSAYLAVLQRAGLVTQRRQGTSLQYRAAIDTTQGLLDYLVLDCCRARPDLCLQPLAEAEAEPHPHRLTVLFLCTGNAARSIMAEAILRHLASDRFAVYSAGLHPQAAPHPEALRRLAAQGVSAAGLRSKSYYDLPAGLRFDFAFTLCDQAANEDCPVPPGQPIGAHWSLPDPARHQGDASARAQAFQRVYDALFQRIQGFVELPLTALDRISQQQAVDDLAARETLT